MSERILGVLGGMGPLASAHFMTRLTQLTPAQRDQDHIPAVLWSDPRLPDRAPALLGQDGAADPLPGLLRGARALRAAGCGAIAIPCNTAHGWAEALAAEGGLPVLHIVDATAAELRQALRPGAAIGLMGTTATLRLRLFQDRLQPQGWRCLVPDDDELTRLVMPAIDAVKAGHVARSFAPVMRAVRSLQARGAEAVVLGCTELPISLAAGADEAAALPVIIDTIDALARLAIAWARGQDAVAAAAERPVRLGSSRHQCRVRHRR